MPDESKQEDELTISGYRTQRVKQGVAWTLIILTLGVFRLVFYWRPDWMIRFTCVSVSLSQAEYVILQDQYAQVFVEKVECQRSKKETWPGRIRTCKDSKDHESKNSETRSLNPLDDFDQELENERYFVNKKIKYIWNRQRFQFEKLRGLEDGISFSDLQEARGVSDSLRSTRQALYGGNSITVHVTPVIKLLLTQALHPFYVFQVISSCLWIADDYFYYAICILVISIISLAVQVHETRSMQKALKNTLSPPEPVNVYRVETGVFDRTESDRLVPGDVIEIPRRGCVMQCDAVIISGNCIVNESMLTGESTPVNKTSLANTSLHKSNLGRQKFCIAEHSQHILFCGTNVIQTRYYGNQVVKAVVVRTGFSTLKGELVRSILFPKPVDFKFTHDISKFIACLSVLAIGGMVYTIIIKVQRGDEIKEIIIRSLDVVTIVVPPTLPAAMTVGIVFAQKRLKLQKIFCISPRSINLSGALNVFCFDKTGTLTEEGLDFRCVVPVQEKTFHDEQREISKLNPSSNAIVVAMATCHSLTRVEGKLVGNPLDLKMFETTQWVLDEPGKDTLKYDSMMLTTVHPCDADCSASSDGDAKMVPHQFGILRQFIFSSKVQRMSVITRELSSTHFDVYCKGSPEMIVSLCIPDTVPTDFSGCLMHYTQKGYRVLGLAHRCLPKMTYVRTQRASRDEIETDLTFLGLLVMENRLKPESKPAIETLRKANVRPVMVTGDNMMTALTVARDASIIDPHDRVIVVNAIPSTPPNPPHIEFIENVDKRKPEDSEVNDLKSLSQLMEGKTHFAISGKSWSLIRKIFPEVLLKLAEQGTVFSHFLPDQKQQLIELLQEVGYYVGMCGDGANDCGALRTAHTGISLSDAEASVASPFTSKERNISCVPIVIREGRAALVTSHGMVMFMIGYSLTTFLGVCILYWFSTNMSEFQFFYIDIVITVLAITYCHTEAYPELSYLSPNTRLFSVMPVLSVISLLSINVTFQIFVWKWTMQQPWFEPFVPNPDDQWDFQCYEVTVVFCVLLFQYPIMAVVCSKGLPYRKSIFSNYWFLASLVIFTIINVYITIIPFKEFCDFLMLRIPPSLTCRGLLVGLAAINFLSTITFEKFVTSQPMLDHITCFLQNKFTKKPTNHLSKDCEMDNRPHCPSVSESTVVNMTQQDFQKLDSLGTIVNEPQLNRNDDVAGNSNWWLSLSGKLINRKEDERNSSSPHDDGIWIKRPLLDSKTLEKTQV